MGIRLDSTSEFLKYGSQVVIDDNMIFWTGGCPVRILFIWSSDEYIFLKKERRKITDWFQLWSDAPLLYKRRIN